MPESRKPLDVAADVLFYAPIGLAIQVGKALPELAESGRSRLQAPLAAARVVGQMAVEQGRREMGERLRKATEPYFGAGPSPAGSPPPPTAASPARPEGSNAASTTFSSVPAAADLAIPGYSTLSATQVVRHLEGLSQAELDTIAAYETATRRRKTILARIEQLRSVSG